jgi:CheY-like chemotaxis protein
MMTAYAVPDLIAQAEREGAVAVLAKPLPLDRVLRFLTQLAPAKPVLIVEDDPQFRAGLRDILEAHGYVVAAASDAAEAQAALRASPPDVLLLDLKLPVGSGYEVLREARALCPNAAVLLMTGYAQEYHTQVTQGLRDGALLCLEKPFDPSDMLRHIHEAQVQRAAREFSGHCLHGQ